MKTFLTLVRKNPLVVTALLLFFSAPVNAQISLVCTNPTNVAYGLTSNGEIYEINSINGATIRTIKNNTYAGLSPNSANGLGFNSFNNTFYYFKRNVTVGTEQFVSFTPATGVVSILAKSTCTDDIHTGCVSYNGKGYYTIDVQGTMHYYDIVNNKWTFITSKIVDQNGKNITTLIKTQSAGDMAIDGIGNLWLLTSSNTNYGLYKFPANLPTTSVAQVNVVCVINPTAVTPTGNSFAGIAFRPNGQVLMTTKNDDKLYLLQTTNSLTFLGNLTTSDIGNDLTACVFPAGILPISWKSFNATVQNNNRVVLNWEVIEYQNKGYYIEYSSNGSDWNEIGFVAARNTQGNTDSYSYSQVNNGTGRQYYRIRQVDNDGAISYSEIQTVTLKNDNPGISIWPNPATDQVRIVGNGKETNTIYTLAQVFDLSGRMMIEMPLQAAKNTINISKLPTGTYLIKVHTNDGTTQSQKIVKQ